MTVISSLLLLFLALSTATSKHSTNDAFIGTWTSPPKNVPSDKTVDGPLLGNGDMGVTFGGNTSNIVAYIGKNDFWYLNKAMDPESRIIGLGHVSISFPRTSTTPSFYELQQFSNEGTVTFNISSITGNFMVSQSSNLLIIDFRHPWDGGWPKLECYPSSDFAI